MRVSYNDVLAPWSWRCVAREPSAHVSGFTGGTLGAGGGKVEAHSTLYFVAFINFPETSCIL
jgi:hypothetical protein